MTFAGRVAMLGVLAALALGGCAGFDHSPGWRAAEVVALGRAGDLAASADQDCRAAGAPTAPYAVVRYQNGGLHSRSLGTDQLPAGAGLKVGDEVYVNILDCTAVLTLPGQHRALGTAPPH